MDRWSGILKAPLYPNSTPHCRVAASLCLSSSSKTVTVPSVNAIFFSGDRVEGTGNPVIERLSNLERIAEILVSKLGGSINAWVIEASTFNGPFAVYKDFIPSVNHWGEPKVYNPAGFPASTSTISLLSNCFKEVKQIISGSQKEQYQTGVSASCLCTPKTFIFGFSKGGTVLNQLMTELSISEIKSTENPINASEQLFSGGPVNGQEENPIVPSSVDGFLNSIAEIHYVDVGLNSTGAYLTDSDVIERISKRLMEGEGGIRVVLHGTPRQWCDSRRVLIRNEKDKLVQLLESGAQRSGGKLHVCERFYFADKPPSLQMHFEIIENLNVH
ncbi:uncharacterized protein LOC132276445 [Cornus florida]|uniref:uncharacterized protein LOC132276445 n=1 Tax=Cornus florida TaxID=4283 RepID=UPI00289B8CFE|nr:uncharacterized protein LOC132276445 [Cornus florida]